MSYRDSRGDHPALIFLARRKDGDLIVIQTSAEDAIDFPLKGLGQFIEDLQYVATTIRDEEALKEKTA